MVTSPLLVSPLKNCEPFLSKKTILPELSAENVTVVFTPFKNSMVPSPGIILTPFAIINF